MAEQPKIFRSNSCLPRLISVYHILFSNSSGSHLVSKFLFRLPVPKPIIERYFFSALAVVAVQQRLLHYNQIFHHLHLHLRGTQLSRLLSLFLIVRPSPLLKRGKIFVTGSRRLVLHDVTNETASLSRSWVFLTT